MKNSITLVAVVVMVAAFGFSFADKPKPGKVESFYTQHDLVSDGAIPADHTDPNLRNAWGIAFNPTGFVWVANNATSTSTLYDGTGAAAPLVVTITSGDPTGIVFSGGSDFKVGAAPSRFLFATESGTIDAWVPGTTATAKVVDKSGAGAVYKGLALGGNGTTHLLYATDFHNNRVDVFDGTFTEVAVPGGFHDPNLPSDFAPFGIQNIGGDIYVTFAKQVPGSNDEAHGKGLGYVDVFDPEGNLVRRVASRGALDAPWGIALAPASFGRFGNDLLVGNFGDGAINAYDLAEGGFRGQLKTAENKVLKIEGLWGLAFGNGVAGQPTNTLFFTAGPNDESDGLYGRIDVAPMEK